MIITHIYKGHWMTDMQEKENRFFSGFASHLYLKKLTVTARYCQLLLERKPLLYIWQQYFPSKEV